MSQQTFRTIRDNYIVLSELTIRSTNRGTIGTCVKYDTYINDKNETNQQNNQQLTSNQPATNHSKGSKGSKGSKEVLQRPSADADGSAPVEPSAGPPRVRKARVPKLPAEPTDPRVNSRSFLKRLEASGLIISWARDGKLVGEILRARLASGVEDPQEELLKLWSRFLTLDSDPVSEVFTMRGRAHDVPAFRQHLNLLIEGASGNGKVHHPQATCPDHGPGAMRREAWAGKLVLKCQTCEFAYRTEALWTDRPQSWEKDLK